MNWITNSVLPKIKAWVQSDDVPDNLWIKCSACNQMIFHREFKIAYNCCSTCGHHAPLAPESRFEMTFDDGTYVPPEVLSKDTNQNFKNGHGGTGAYIAPEFDVFYDPLTFKK